MLKNLCAFVGAFGLLWLLASMLHVGEAIAFWEVSWKTVVCLLTAGYIGFKV